MTDDGGGITRRSLQAWGEHRQLFGTFIEARVYASSDGAVIDGRLCWWDKGILLPVAPAMVLIDDQGNELWLSGTPCGYTGEGSGGAERILREEGFGDAAEAVYDKRWVKVVPRKEEDGRVTAQRTERESALWDEQLLRWLWRQGQVTTGTDRATEAARLTWEDPFTGTW
jgi:hypothetical protein